MHKTFTSKQIAEFVDGELYGDENINISFIGPPNLADESMLAIAFEKEHINSIADTKALCILVPEGITPEGKSYIQVSRPKLAMGILLNLFYKAPDTPEGVHPTAVVDPSAKLGQNISVGANVFIGRETVIGDKTKILPNVYIGSEVVVGSNCFFHPNACIGDRVKIGNEVIIQHGASIGADGYSFITEKASNIETAKESGELGKTRKQKIIKIPSLGSVVIHDDVEIGANACIDRGTIQNTEIGRNTKIDNLVMIGHNVKIGESCFIVSQVGISGSSVIGDRAVLAGQAGVADHVTIGDDVILIAKAGVSKDLPGRAVYGGSPAVPRKDFIKQNYNIKYVEELKKRVAKLEELVLKEEES